MGPARCISDWLCIVLLTSILQIGAEGTSCYTCYGAPSELNCTSVINCGYGQEQACMTIINYNDGHYHVDKKCKEVEACEVQASNSHCYALFIGDRTQRCIHCCHGDKCNYAFSNLDSSTCNVGETYIGDINACVFLNKRRLSCSNAHLTCMFTRMKLFPADDNFMKNLLERAMRKFNVNRVWAVKNSGSCYSYQKMAGFRETDCETPLPFVCLRELDYGSYGGYGTTDFPDYEEITEGTTTNVPHTPPGGRPSDRPQPGQGISVFVWVGVGIGAAIIILLVAILVVVCRRNNKSNKSEKEKKSIENPTYNRDLPAPPTGLEYETLKKQDSAKEDRSYSPLTPQTATSDGQRFFKDAPVPVSEAESHYDYVKPDYVNVHEDEPTDTGQDISEPTYLDLQGSYVGPVGRASTSHVYTNNVVQ